MLGRVTPPLLQLTSPPLPSGAGSSHAVTADLSVGEVARGAQFFLSDGAIVTGAIIDYLIEAQKVSATSAESDNKNLAAKRRVEVTIPPAVLAPDAK